MTTPDEQTLTEQIARVIHDGPNAQHQYRMNGIPVHTYKECPYQAEYLEDARAVLPVVKAAQRDAAREALGSLQSFARECMDGKHGEVDADMLDGWRHTWAAAMQHRVICYPHHEETTR